MNTIPAMSSYDIGKVREFESQLGNEPQLEIKITHELHAGVYSRTAIVPANSVSVGVEVCIPTQLVISGDVTVSTGHESIHLEGYNVLTAQAGRKQVFFAKTETFITMFFATNAQTVEEAEEQFTHEAYKLQTRRGLLCRE